MFAPLYLRFGGKGNGFVCGLAISELYFNRRCGSTSTVIATSHVPCFRRAGHGTSTLFQHSEGMRTSKHLGFGSELGAYGDSHAFDVMR